MKGKIIALKSILKMISGNKRNLEEETTHWNFIHSGSPIGQKKFMIQNKIPVNVFLCKYGIFQFKIHTCT